MTRATSVVGCTRSPISALIEPTLAAQPPFISRSADALGHPALAPDDALDAHHLAGERFVQRHHRVEFGRDRAHHLRVDAGVFASARPLLPLLAVLALLPFLPLLPFGCAGSKRKRTEKSPCRAARSAVSKRPSAPSPPDAPLRAVRLDRARGGASGGVFLRCGRSRMSLVLPRRIQGSVLLIRRCRCPPRARPSGSAPVESPGGRRRSAGKGGVR